MKVALFSRYPKSFDMPKGGVESVTVILARALARLDDTEVHVITLERGSTDELVERDGDVNIHRLPGSSWPQIIDIITGPGRNRLIKKLKELRPDIVHFHETYGLTIGNPETPLLFTVHGFDHANIPAEGRKAAWIRGHLWKMVESFGLGRHKHIVSISPYVTGIIKPQTKAQIYDIDNPVDDRYFNVLRCEEPGRVLCVGWINERKNTLGSVRAFAMALEQGVEGTLVIAGEAQKQSYLDNVRAAIESKGIGERVLFLGHIDREQLVQELGLASVLLLPSHQENAPMAISEAMAAGVPVIVSNRCGMPYMVEEGKSGFLIEPDDISQIADRLIRVLQSSELLKEMGKRGREIAFSRFHPDVVARKTRDVYLEVIGSNN